MNVEPVGPLLKSKTLQIREEKYLNIQTIDSTRSKLYQTACLVSVSETLYPGCVTELLVSV